MRQLISLSNGPVSQDLSPDNYDWLEPLLARRHLDGIEVELGGPWDLKVLPAQWICGAYLNLGDSWLDFWRQDRQALLRQFGSEAGIKARYGTLDRDEWLEGYRQKIDDARAAGATYLVLPVSEVKPWETYTWQFGATDTEVISAAVEVINELIAPISEAMALLFANQWWPGLRLLDKKLAARLIHGVKHPNIGFMLDTGHLMNTNQKLKTEVESVDYILAVLRKLGPYGRYMRGLHLNCSLSGEYVQRKQKPGNGSPGGPAELLAHLVHIDEHRPFRVPAVKRIIYAVKPELLVHHFRAELVCEWERKIRRQQEALLSPAERRRQGVGICR
ncbi:TIM barrel protein [Sporomusa termitida]|uniref:Xylose isomerase-like TIM barrel n=1 Tax=Sporomusa termitida TaxID=2377 RepID=A0A517E0R6_9FIRM|nr:TIM barrel protein [Sporomusa termitida]QDR83190.1 Xylose isomerase-like TIM barrel [Sporomusa termitida]